MANKITTIVDFETSAAKTKLSTFKSAIDDAEGASGKLKAGFGVAKDAIIANAGTIAAGAGAALVAFGVKAVGAFEDTAKAAINLGAATGLSTEAASRWIGVADDYAVSAEDLQVGLGRIAKTLDDTKWEKYGIATHDAGGKARDVNDILLDSFDKLSNIKNATDRAKAGNELFGKGYAKLAPLIGHTKDEYRKMLDTVEDGQVITEGEAKKAEAMRHAQDDLHDALKEVTLALGGLVAESAPTIEALAKMVEKALQVEQVMNRLGLIKPFADLDNLGGRVNEIEAARKKFQEYDDTVRHQVMVSIDDLDRAHKNLATGGMSDVEYQEKQNTIAAADYAAQVDETNRQVKSDIDDMEYKWDELHGAIDQEKALIHYRQQVEDVKQAHLDVGTAIEEHGAGSPEHIAALEDARLKELDLQDVTATLAKQYTDMPPEKVTELTAKLDDASISALPDEIEAAAHSKTYGIDVHIDSITADGETHVAGSVGNVSVGGGAKPPPHYASGTNFAPGGAALVGEHGPEVVNLPRGSQVIPNNALGGIGEVHIHVQSMPTPNQLVAILAKYSARNGPAALRAIS